VVNRWLGKPIDEIAPTFGFAIHTIAHPSGALLNVWDIGGQASIRSFWRNYFEQTDGIVWVVDSSAPERLSLCGQELYGVLQEDRMLSASLLILANKQDVSGAVGVDQIKAVLDWTQIEKRCRCKIVLCSALKDDAGIGEGLDWLVSNISNRLSYN